MLNRLPTRRKEIDMYQKVTQDEFYKKIGEKDVVLEVKESYPYKTLFKLRENGCVVGCTVEDGFAIGISSYYIER